MFCYRGGGTRVEAAFTDRYGGVSRAPYDSLNLAAATGDDHAAVERNYQRVAAALGMAPHRIARMRETHGSTVATIGRAPETPPCADGLVTNQPGLVLSVRAADCAPVLLADTAHGVVGCAHAGRRGLVNGMVAGTVTAMRALGARRITAWVGPYICGSCYEVSDRLRDEVADVVPESKATTAWGTPALDIGAGVAAQLRELGCEVVDEPAVCTRTSKALYSHRRDGVTGRFAGLVWIKP